MLNIKKSGFVWDEELKPAGHGEVTMEAFDTWWRRNQKRLQNLHPQIAEQWVYKHWHCSPWGFLPLDSLGWRQETWPTSDILEQVHMEYGGPLDADFDYEVIHLAQTKTARYWRDGTWNIPMLIINTPRGVETVNGPLPEVQHALVEGTLRMRYLNALHSRGEDTGPHRVFVLTMR